jgi:cytochrome c
MRHPAPVSTWKSHTAAGVITTSVLLALALTLAQMTPARADGSPTRGRILFLRCASCHDISATASQKIGPNLRGVVGRKVASLAGYRYSPALAAQDFLWDRPQLDRWLTNPAAVVPGTMMAFAGIDNAQDRDAIITYLSQPPSGQSPAGQSP